MCMALLFPQTLLIGIGADEQLGGYSRHRTKFKFGLYLLLFTYFIKFYYTLQVWWLEWFVGGVRQGYKKIGTEKPWKRRPVYVLIINCNCKVCSPCIFKMFVTSSIKRNNVYGLNLVCLFHPIQIWQVGIEEWKGMGNYCIALCVINYRRKALFGWFPNI